MGQGLKTTYARIAGMIFGLPPEAIDVVQGDTATTPEGPGSYGSRSLYTGRVRGRRWHARISSND